MDTRSQISNFPDSAADSAGLNSLPGISLTNLDCPEFSDKSRLSRIFAQLKAGQIRGWKDKDWGQPVEVDVSLEHADAQDYAALVLPGGVMNPDILRTKPEAVEFVRAFDRASKPLAAICHGPWLLAESGAAKGRKVTSWPSLKTDLENAGAHWQDAEVVVDGHVITSRKPDDIPAFTQAIIDWLSKP